MERIVYRKTLDAHKNGVQFTLQGFETADKMTRTIELSLMASGDAIDLPLEQLSAIMYITTPYSTEPSVDECRIKDNTIVYDVLPIVEEGITEMQLKLIETRPDGASGVLMSPKFAIEVTKSNSDDESVTQSTTYTALENAIASAKAVYDTRILRVEIDTDCMFRVVYADGTVYETDVLNETLLKGEAVLSQSYARGGTGARTGEDTDNSMYYANVSKGASIDANKTNNDAIELLNEARKHGVYTAFSIDFESGEVKYISPAYKFNINKDDGNLEAIGQTYTPEATIDLVVTEWLNQKGAAVNNLNYRMDMVEEALGNGNDTLQRMEETVSSVEQTTNAMSESVSEHTSHLNNLLFQVDDIMERFVNAENDIGDVIKYTSELTTSVFDRIEHDYAELNETKISVAELQEEMGEVSNSLDGIADYIIETKTVGMWTCERWASGKAVCWGTTDSMLVEYTAPWYGIHYTSVSCDLPTNFFSATPSFVSIDTLSGMDLLANSISGVSTNAVSWYAMSHKTEPAELTVRFMIKVIGKYK